MISTIKCPNCENKFKMNDDEYNKYVKVEEIGLVKKHKFTCPHCKNRYMFKKELNNLIK